MRTIIDLPEESLKHLAAICQAEDISRAEVIRRAVSDYVAQREAKKADKAAERKKILDETFGAWADNPRWKGVDSVEYVRALRGEWDRTEDKD